MDYRSCWESVTMCAVFCQAHLKLEGSSMETFSAAVQKRSPHMHTHTHTCTHTHTHTCTHTHTHMHMHTHARTHTHTHTRTHTHTHARTHTHTHTHTPTSDLVWPVKLSPPLLLGVINKRRIRGLPGQFSLVWVVVFVFVA